MNDSLNSADNGVFTPEKLLDAHRLSSLQILTFALCFVLNMIDGMDVVIVSYSASSIVAEMGITRVQMGGVFSAGLIGMAIGGLLLGAIADVIGRRKLILAGVSLIALGVVLGGYAQSIPQLLITRIIAGVGIGGLLASVTALTSEYAPAKVKNIVVMLVTAGYPLGALLTGLICAWAVPTFGWRPTMIGAGFLTALMVPICFVLLPESLSFLAGKGGDKSIAKIDRILARMKQSPLATPIRFAQSAEKFKVGDLLGPQYRHISWRLWAGLICTFMTMYYLLSWIPKIAIDSGLAPRHAIIAGAMFSGGGFVGVLMAGIFATRYGYIRSIISYCIIAFLMMLIYSVYRGELVLVLMIAFVMGFAVQGAVGSFYGTAAKVYAANIKSTGIGWTIGVGRIGAIVGPYLGGVLLSMDLSLFINFAIFGGIMLLGAFFIAPLRHIVDV